MDVYWSSRGLGASRVDGQPASSMTRITRRLLSDTSFTSGEEAGPKKQTHRGSNHCLCTCQSHPCIWPSCLRNGKLGIQGNSRRQPWRSFHALHHVSLCSQLPEKLARPGNCHICPLGPRATARKRSSKSPRYLRSPCSPCSNAGAERTLSWPMQQWEIHLVPARRSARSRLST